MTPRTITLKDGRVVEVEVQSDDVFSRAMAFAVGMDIGCGTGPTEAAAIEALRKKLEDRDA